MPTAEVAPLLPATMTSPDPAPLKKALRAEALARRRAAHEADAAGAARAVREIFLAEAELPPGAVVAGYSPIGDELDPRPLLAALDARHLAVALPVVVETRQPLAFRRWRPGEPLERGLHGTWHPPESEPEVVPDVVLVPMVAFDDAGWRLGYGGGYYDRTLAALRRAGPVSVIGVAYAAQRVPRVPRDAYDQHMDWMLTEDGLKRT